MPPVLQGFGAFLVGAPRRLLDPAGGVQGDPGDLLGGEAPLGVIDGQGQPQWAILERCFSIGSLAFLTLRHSSFRVRWSATVMDEGYGKKGYDSPRCR